ncbi:MAG TPA: sulfate ABC transporter permease subunit CysT [Deltaproteobacteria bacterium]|nr:MAG: sulfate ABC transporter permease subunit CysT [Deltaproteobacteria bacterium GWA2_45_12]HBF13829.1 sulfate ABC transporter permease subunit CysT [Deltaproteobacteria bacterium]
MKLLKEKSVLPGFGTTMGFTLFYLSLLVLIPLSMLFLKTSTLGWNGFWDIILSPRIAAACRLSFFTALASAGINAIVGLLLAWVLVRYDFPGKKIMDAFVDLPFALPTAVAGITLTSLYSQNGFMGKILAPLGIKVAFTPLGIILALTFIGLPFVVRTVQPVLEDLDTAVEEAAVCLGATRIQTFFKILLPVIFPSLITGFTLAFARAIGEYGSVVFISGNLPMKTEIAPLLIVSKLEQYDYTGATAIALFMLGVSFILLLTINILQWWSQSKQVEN